nr:hypothetical protein [Methanobacterium formicicum]
MNDEIKHRGPDDNGFYCNDKLSLGSVRLSIIDLSDKGHMPMFSRDNKFAIVYNGEIYNYLDIKYELLEKGYKFNSNTDTEVLLYSYIEWGSKCVEKFNGMWAFAIYDIEKDIIFLSRDRFGVKPLYYYYDNGEFIFSSEIKGILKHEMDIKANENLIFDFFYIQDILIIPRKHFFKNIKKIKTWKKFFFFNLNDNSISTIEYYNLKKALKTKKIQKSKEIRDSFF